MNFFKQIAEIVIVGVLSWFWMAGLISHAIYEWFKAIELHRTKMDEQVEQLLSKVN